MYYDPMPIDLMVCVCEGHLGGTLMFVRDIRRGGPGWGVEGEQQRCVDFSFFDRFLTNYLPGKAFYPVTRLDKFVNFSGKAKPPGYPVTIPQ